MSEFHEGDLVEAVKGEESVRARLHHGTSPHSRDYLYLGHTSDLSWYESSGWTVTVIEKAAPPLPTEPGFYLNCRNELWTLEKNGSWRNDYDDPETPAAVFNSAPFTRLEPVPVTAKRFAERLREQVTPQIESHWYTSATARDILKKADAVAVEFGVTTAEVQR